MPLTKVLAVYPPSTCVDLTSRCEWLNTRLTAPPFVAAEVLGASYVEKDKAFIVTYRAVSGVTAEVW